MPALDDNRRRWDGGYDWSQRGEEWSAGWGGVEWQWWGTIYPRIARFLPTGTILEIAPGYGRWTAYLKDHCERLVGVDLSGECVEACKERFSFDGRLQFIQNDGKSLDGIADESVDFAFSYDSLVHVESDVLIGYLRGLVAKLSAEGVAVLHHSNVAAYPLLIARDHNHHWRAETVSASLVRTVGARLGLSVIHQELHVWGSDTTILSDCVTTLTRQGSSHDQDACEIVENPGFTEEMRLIRTLAEKHSPDTAREILRVTASVSRK